MRSPGRADFGSQCNIHGTCWSLMLFAIAASVTYWFARPPSRPNSHQEAVADNISISAISSMVPAAVNGTSEVSAALVSASARLTGPTISRLYRLHAKQLLDGQLVTGPKSSMSQGLAIKPHGMQPSDTACRLLKELKWCLSRRQAPKQSCCCFMDVSTAAQTGGQGLKAAHLAQVWT